MADAAGGEAAVAEEGVTGEEADAAQNVPEPTLQADGEQRAPADLETRSAGKIKKIFGSLLKPFRGGGRKPDVNK